MTISIFNQDIKGLIYLGGVLIGSFVWLMMLFLVKSDKYDDALESCNLIDLPFDINQFNNPNYSSYFIGFTIAYLLLPMYYNDQMNWVVFIFLLLLFIADAYCSIIKKCTSNTGPILGGIVGILIGGLWFTIFHATGNDDLLYFQELLSNNVICKRPKKQTFKCAVYKKGELISSNIV